MGHWTTFCSRLRRRLIVLAMLPVIVIFFLGQRFFVQGIVMSGIKG